MDKTRPTPPRTKTRRRKNCRLYSASGSSKDSSLIGLDVGYVSHWCQVGLVTKCFSGSCGDHFCRGRRPFNDDKIDFRTDKLPVSPAETNVILLNFALPIPPVLDVQVTEFDSTFKLVVVSWKLYFGIWNVASNLLYTWPSRDPLKVAIRVEMNPSAPFPIGVSLAE